MTAKYYIPTIEEFHIGFIYEIQDLDDDLVTTIFRRVEFTIADTLLDIEDYIKKGEIRVKTLCKEDIEELGYIVEVNELGQDTDQNELGIRRNSYVDNGYFAALILDNEIDSLELFGIFFKCKNISEFKRLLEQTAISK